MKFSHGANMVGSCSDSYTCSHVYDTCYPEIFRIKTILIKSHICINSIFPQCMITHTYN